MGVLLNFIDLFYIPTTTPQEIGTALKDGRRRLSKNSELFHFFSIWWSLLRFLLPIKVVIFTRVTPCYRKKWGGYAGKERGEICIICWRLPTPSLKVFSFTNLYIITQVDSQYNQPFTASGYPCFLLSSPTLPPPPPLPAISLSYIIYKR